MLFLDIAFMYYAGSQHFMIRWINGSDEDIILAESKEYVILFAWFLCLNIIFIGILWLLYLFKHNKFQSSFFAYFMFVVDLYFDAFYAVFPLLLVSNEFNFITAAASLNSQSFILFIAAYIPLCYLVFKLNTVLQLSTKYARKQWKYQFHKQKFDNLLTSVSNLSTNIDACNYAPPITSVVSPTASTHLATNRHNSPEYTIPST